MNSQRYGVPLSQKTGFAIADSGLALYWFMAESFILYYYLNVLGISNVTAGLIVGGATLWDAITDPAMGYIADRTRTRWGKFKPYLLFASLPAAVSYILVFWTPGLEGAIALTFVTSAHLLFRTCTTALTIPYAALTARVTQDADQRTSIAIFRVYGNVVGAAVVALATLPLVKIYGGDDQAAGFLGVSITYALIAIVLHVAAFRLLKEPQSDAAASTPAPKLGAVVRMLLHNRPLQILLLAIVVVNGALISSQKAGIFFVEHYFGNVELQGQVLAVTIVAFSLSFPFWGLVMKRFSKRAGLVSGCILSLSAGIAFFVIPQAGFIFYLVAIFCSGFGRGAFAMGSVAMAGDTVEYGEWRSGVRAEAMIFAMMAFCQKASLALATVMIGFALDVIGFQADQTPSEQTILGLKALVSVIPAGFIAVVAVLLTFYRLDAATHSRLKAEIEARKRPGSKDAEGRLAAHASTGAMPEPTA